MCGGVVGEEQQLRCGRCERRRRHQTVTQLTVRQRQVPAVRCSRVYDRVYWDGIWQCTQNVTFDSSSSCRSSSFGGTSRAFFVPNWHSVYQCRPCCRDRAHHTIPDIDPCMLVLARVSTHAPWERCQLFFGLIHHKDIKDNVTVFCQASHPCVCVCACVRVRVVQLLASMLTIILILARHGKRLSRPVTCASTFAPLETQNYLHDNCQRNPRQAACIMRMDRDSSEPKSM